MRIRILSAALGLTAMLSAFGCSWNSHETPAQAAQGKATEQKKEEPKAAGEVKRAEIGKQKNIIIETQGDTRVC